MIWHSTSVSEVADKFDSDISKGLSDFQVAENLKKYGANKLAESKKRSFLQRFFSQMKDVMVVILLIAAVISFIVGCLTGSQPDAEIQGANWITSLFIILIVILNGILGVIRESRAEKALDSLKNLAPPKAKVIRNGQPDVIDAVDVVPGDIIILEDGDYIPADGRIISSSSLHCLESSLTGESVPVEKYTEDRLDDITPLGDRYNMVFSGCSVTSGSGIAIVTDTGMFTEMGKMANVIETTHRTEPPLQERLKSLGKTLSVFVLFICAFIFVYGMIFADGPILDRFITIFMTSVSLAVAAVPECLATIVTVVLATGVRRMYKKNATIRTLSAAENLGNTSVICTDKTGSLTDSRMKAVCLFDGNDTVQLNSELTNEQKRILLMAALCGDSSETDQSKFTNIDHTDFGIFEANEQLLNMKKTEIENIYPRVCFIPFDHERQLRTSVNLINGKPVCIVRGAPDIILEKCSSENGKIFKEAYDKMGSMALRVIGVAFKELDFEPTDPTPEELENDLTFCGLIGLMNPIREDAVKAIARCKKAGIRMVMLTGDHITTAVSVGKKLGLFDDGSVAITGSELEKISDEELADKIENISVYARVTPSDKIRIVKAWQNKHQVVIMTGDGVNDCPALNAADVGCAMGSGSEVAKNAADVTVSDDKFSTIVSAVEAGRGIFDSIRKAVFYLLSCSIAEVLAVLIAMLIWRKTSLTAIQLIFLNFVTAGFPALALGNGRPNREVMKQPPRKREDGIFDLFWSLLVALQGVAIGIISMIAFTTGYISANSKVGCTMAFATLAISQLIQALCLSSRYSLFAFKKYHVNYWLFAAVLGSFGIILAIMLSPAQQVFNLVLLSGAQWALVILLPVALFVLTEIVKRLLANKEKKSGKAIF